jgi:hypothetical protein
LPYAAGNKKIGGFTFTGHSRSVMDLDITLHPDCPRVTETLFPYIGQHSWECGQRGYSVARLRRAFRDFAASAQRLFTNYSSRFFLMEKSNPALFMISLLSLREQKRETEIVEEFC